MRFFVWADEAIIFVLGIDGAFKPYRINGFLIASDIKGI
jgi:hypothetical protein